MLTDVGGDGGAEGAHEDHADHEPAVHEVVVRPDERYDGEDGGGVEEEAEGLHKEMEPYPERIRYEDLGGEGEAGEDEDDGDAEVVDHVRLEFLVGKRDVRL